MKKATIDTDSLDGRVQEFRVSKEDIEAFKAKCKANKTTMTNIFRQLIKGVNSGNIPMGKNK